MLDYIAARLIPVLAAGTAMVRAHLQAGPCLRFPVMVASGRARHMPKTVQGAGEDNDAARGTA
jgi:hypothetical protein